MARATLGEFEHQVMATLIRLGGESYSVPITLDLEERIGREVAQPAVYIALRRMEKKGLLTSRLDDHAVGETGRERRYFRPTRVGLRRLRDSRTALERVWEGLDTSLLDEA